MKAILALPLALLLLLPATTTAAQLDSFDATAAGTTSFVISDWWTGQVHCTSGAAFALEINLAAGAVAWDAPGCAKHAESSGATGFTFHCTDACWHDCDLDWTGTTLECWNDGTHLTLARDGAFTFSHESYRDGRSYLAEASGVLLVATWPTTWWSG